MHSLLIALSEFNTRFHFVSPEEIRLPNEYKQIIENKGLAYFEYTKLNDSIKKADITYMTRLQRERFNIHLEYERTKNAYILTNSMLNDTKDNMRVLHPLHRVNEINTDVDSNPKAYYFQQILNGVYVRQAIISSILEIY